MQQTPVTQLRENMTAFPEPETVFAADEQWLAQHLLPLLSFDLGDVCEVWRGTVVHMLAPVEPEEGCIGQETTAFHNEYAATNWFALRLDAQNRYHFLGDPRYFARDTTQPESNAFYADILQSYARNKALFRATGKIPYGEFLEALGGGFCDSNWTETQPIPAAFELTVGNPTDGDPNNGIRITLNGKPLYNIAWVSAYQYVCYGADTIMLFYEPESRTVLFTFDWT